MVDLITVHFLYEIIAGLKRVGHVYRLDDE